MPRMLLFMLLLPAVAFGASFDCKQAATVVEKLICRNAELSELDKTLSELFLSELERPGGAAALQSAQKKWLTKRNACTGAACIQREYERRIAQLACDSDSTMAGSAIGANQCADYSLRVLEHELLAVEARYGRQIAKDSNNPDYTASTFKEEQRAWRTYRSAQCALQGAVEGGSDGWKNAFAGMCEVEATQKRIEGLKKELAAQ
ncbi:MAG: lysozyme inhibitor LprI family protein [Pseudomonadota bacterium]|nr:lysozyme inhibitor LprI family protein [Pseudomonadota bacterium]